MLCEGATGTESFVHPYPSPPPFANLRRCLQGLLPPTPGKQQRDDDTMPPLRQCLPPSLLKKTWKTGRGRLTFPHPRKKVANAKKNLGRHCIPLLSPPFLFQEYEGIERNTTLFPLPLKVR